jgi:hypothetical protein
VSPEFAEKFKLSHYRSRGRFPFSARRENRRLFLLTSPIAHCRYNLIRVPRTPRPNLRTRLRRIFLTAILTIVGTAALAFGMDYAVFRIRMAMNWNAYGSVRVNHYTAVLQKNGKTTLTFDPPQAWTCVNALFPHSGSLPCWYLRRHPDQRTDI